MITHQALVPVSDISQSFSDIAQQFSKLSREERFKLFEFIQGFESFDIISNLPIFLVKKILQDFTPKEICALRTGKAKVFIHWLKLLNYLNF